MELLIAGGVQPTAAVAPEYGMPVPVHSSPSSTLLYGMPVKLVRSYEDRERVLWPVPAEVSELLVAAVALEDDVEAAEPG